MKHFDTILNVGFLALGLVSSGYAFKLMFDIATVIK